MLSKRISAVVCAVVLVGAAIASYVAVAAPAPGTAPYLSPIAIVADKAGSTLYVAMATGNKVATIDVAGGKVGQAMPVSGSPEALALSPDGGKLFVAISVPAGKVAVLDPKSGKETASIAVGHTPSAVAVSPDGKFLYVANKFNNDVSKVDVDAGKEIARIAVVRQPSALAITADGKKLLVTNLLPVGPSNADSVAAVVSVIDTASAKQTATIALPNGSSSVRDVCISPDGKFAYVTHVLSRYQLPTTQLDRGWMNTNAFTIIDVAADKVVNTALLDNIDRGAANPWGTAISADGKTLVIAHGATHEISVIDIAALHQKLADAAEGKIKGTSANDVPNDLAFLVGVRQRVKLGGNGPRGVAIVGTKAYAAEYFTDTVAVADIASPTASRPTLIAMGPVVPETKVRKGERLFNDGLACFQQWQSCLTCHPDVRVDALNWDLLNDGIGNPKNTKSMLLSHQTPPAMSTGVRESAEFAVRSGFKFIQFALPPEEDMACVDDYLKSLTPVPSPYLVNGKLSEAAQRGEKLYKDAGCAACHPAGLQTDLKQHIVGTGIGREENEELDTPTLVECWRTGPYLYLGQAATMEEVLTTFNKGDKHGVTSKLTPAQIKDLAEFILSQ